MTLPKILISACLLGRPVRYNGSAKPVLHPALRAWQKAGQLVIICPEVAAGFSTPRPPAEITQGQSGPDVLASTARVQDTTGADVTDQFITGAKIALALAQEQNCKFAILTDASPSCGSTHIYDGAFQGQKHPGTGVTTALLRAHGMQVFAETEIDGLVACLSKGRIKN
ncbi:hypothetical protein AA14337_2667 [Acetobacter malorum DSM 14337]|uniref:Purine nucleoside phosphorylase n=1 Tax=Acetobacter malorum DSM 14337 TaxID=1307910 RepID=A0ABQ0PX33_9PROT|nr:DUF523 domain-containing protein [Acetobacter malorum]GBQ83734.1 hypothetical protein AA14337_2667 [Acetobacter malorum DSM 14337]